MLEWSESTFRSIRRASIDKISSLLQQSTQSGSKLLIVDDIMYLRSMRREVYKLARQYSIPLLTIWVDTSMDIALYRNGTRQGRQRIPDETIEKIHSRFEAPSTTGSIVDRYCMTIDGTSEER